jgi:hypothetical protein
MKSPALRSILFGLTLTLMFVANPSPSRAAGEDNSLKLIDAIPDPGPNPLAVDISFVDQRAERYYLADSSNKTVDVFDVDHGTLLGQISGNFHGIPTTGQETTVCGVPNFDARGPSGVLVANGNRLWVTDFAGYPNGGLVKVFDLADAEPPFSMVTPAATIAFSDVSKCRADELSFDPRGSHHPRRFPRNGIGRDTGCGIHFLGPAI